MDCLFIPGMRGVSPKRNGIQPQRPQRAQRKENDKNNQKNDFR
jgi:hypothetical protein